MNSKTNIKINSKPLPVGVDNFEKLRAIDYYYVDKTLLIKELLSNRAEVTLFTRPRRFGKTLNMSMLQSFFEVGSRPELFNGLAIEDDKEFCAQHRGKYPVVFISLKDVDEMDFASAYRKLCGAIRSEVQRLEFLHDSDNISASIKLPFKRLLYEEETRDDIGYSLKLLTRLLYLHYGQKAILLIDEYDVPLDKAYQAGYYEEMIALLRGMFGQALKTNDYLNFAVLTGCMRVSKESIFTGLNNLDVHSITDVLFAEYFGFTDREVQTMLAYYGLQEHYKDVKEWYDGYLFGEQDVYCPWDVIKYCRDLLASRTTEPQAYWLNSSGNDIIRRLLDKAVTATIRLEIEQLLAGRSIRKKLNLQLTHNEIDRDIDNVWSLLFISGYLTTTARPRGGIYELVIPNKEIRQIYQEQVLTWLREKVSADNDRLGELFAALTAGDAAAVQVWLNKMLLTSISFFDAYETFYHGFLLALLSTCADWQVTSNQETGLGRSDIMVQSEDGQLGIIIEVKHISQAAAAQDTLAAVCQQALQQIKQNQYAAVLQEQRVPHIWLYGITFYRKQCQVLAQKLN